MIENNSPTVRELINNMPTGTGNFQPLNLHANNGQQFNMPFPSPKEMALDQEAQNRYIQEQFDDGSGMRVFGTNSTPTMYPEKNYYDPNPYQNPPVNNNIPNQYYYNPNPVYGAGYYNPQMMQQQMMINPQMNPQMVPQQMNPQQQMMYNQQPQMNPQQQMMVNPQMIQQQQMINQQMMQQPQMMYNQQNPYMARMFDGYSNPYMGYGMNTNMIGYGPAYSGPQQMMKYYDEDAQIIDHAAALNKVSYGEQLAHESYVYKKLSRLTSKILNRSEKEAEKCEKTFDIYDKRAIEEEQRRLDEEYLQRKKKAASSMRVVIKFGDKIVADSAVNLAARTRRSRIMSSEEIDRNEWIQEQKRERIKNYQIYMYNNAMEREYDRLGVVEFFNEGAPRVMNEYNNRKKAEEFRKINFESMINRRAFANEITKAVAKRSRSEQQIVDKFVGRYGVMPDGRPTLPQNDPAIAESFSYNPWTGQYTVTTPNFIQERIDAAKSQFINSIDENNRG